MTIEVRDEKDDSKGKMMEEKMPDDWEPTSMGGGDGWRLNVIYALMIPFVMVPYLVMMVIHKFKKPDKS